jgi:hypothetical protein
MKEIFIESKYVSSKLKKRGGGNSVPIAPVNTTTPNISILPLVNRLITFKLRGTRVLTTIPIYCKDFQTHTGGWRFN